MKKINWQYTIGEILIVIVGISIAFSMNKCAEHSKNESHKKQYLTNLINDVTSDKKALEENVLAIEKKINTTKEILPKLNTNAPDKMSIIGKVFSIVALNNFTPNDNTYQALINSGDFKLIDDFEMKTAIEKHYATYENMSDSYERLENIQKKYVGDYFIHNIDYDDFSKGQFGFKDEKLLKNIILSMRGAFDLKLKATKTGIKSCDNLLTILKKA
ncbi:DUF6090 family protein [Sabulilitoribacter multivorans]|uniref:DUF6090 family protein n=1 Tax=Flaviramulus multivorans TaxID=1304750 RepID=A0ABS9IFV1_9FLAO|nr:DUF6090 family protein [Flaviramulus multivorans]MCF7559057.1 DUF6090 family protein [Flaviramulus multivorans]